MHRDVFLLLVPFQQSSEPLTAESSAAAQPLWAWHTAGPWSSWKQLNSQRKVPHTHKGSTHWQRLHRPGMSLTYSLTSNEYIHTCTNKFFRELLEMVFQVSIFQVSFQILTSVKCIPSCLRFKRNLLHSHSPVHRLTVGKTAQLMREKKKGKTKRKPPVITAFL